MSRPKSGHATNSCVCPPANKSPLKDSSTGIIACDDCDDCGSTWMWLLWRQFQGTEAWHIECRCATCGRWVKWLEQTPRHILLADEHSKRRGYPCPTPEQLAGTATGPQGRPPEDDTTQEATSVSSHGTGEKE